MIWRCDLVPQFENYKDKMHMVVDRIGMSGRYILANEAAEFEKEFANYLKVKRVVGVANGTDALILIMKSLRIGDGDEVITTPYTAIPTVSAIIATGATPVFVDICPDSYLIDIEKVGKAITAKTKAVMPVHLFGNIVDIASLKAVVGDIPIIEDACQAHGSKIGDSFAGSMGYASAFSFYPTKNLGGYGDGGAIATNSDELADRLIKMRMYGMVDKDHIVVNGYNSRLDELQAAILTIKLHDLDEMNAQRARIARQYREKLRNDLFVHQRIPDTVYENNHVYTMRYLGNRDNLIAFLEEHDIQSNIYYPVPLHLQEANRYLGYKKGDMPHTEKLCEQAVAVTMYPELHDDTLNYVIEKLNQFEG